jgi:hypothetical protein
MPKPAAMTIHLTFSGDVSAAGPCAKAGMASSRPTIAIKNIDVF